MAQKKLDPRIEIERYRDLSNHEGIVYTFMGEWGRRDIDYAGYLADLTLRGKIHDVDRYKLVLGRTI